MKGLRSAALLVLGGLGACGARPPEPFNVLLVSIDTLRADRLGCYGYERETSPGIDRFASGSVLFADARAESSWTIPSHVSLLSGLHPRTHRVERPELRPSHQVRFLAETLAEEGYYTFAVTGGGWLSEEFGFARGFASFHGERRGLEKTLELAREYIDHRRDQGPFFGFLHTYDVHCPYDPPEPYRSRFRTPGRVEFELDGRCGNPDLNALELGPEQHAYVSDRYDGGVGWMDELLGTFLADLEAEGLFQNTIVILTSDHGEELGEYGAIGHERTLSPESLGVPLIVRVPGIAPRVVPDAVGLIDVVPTLLALLGLAPSVHLDGRSLVSCLEGRALEEAPGRLASLRWNSELDSWNADGHQLLVDHATGETRWFGEAGVEPAALGALRGRLQELEDSHLVPEEAAPSEERLGELRALGYGTGGD